MGKILCGGLTVMFLTITSSALAAVSNASLTTKGYVDAGLNYVNGKVTTLQTTVNGDGTQANPGLINRVTALEQSSAPATIANLETTVNGDGTNANPGLVNRVSDLEETVNGDGTSANPGLAAQIAGKQDALTQTQQNAINSGVTSATVQQVADNASAITTLQGQVKDYVAGDGVIMTAGTGANEGKTVLSVDIVSDWATNKPAWAN